MQCHSYRIIGWLELKGAFKGYLVQPLRMSMVPSCSYEETVGFLVSVNEKVRKKPQALLFQRQQVPSLYHALRHTSNALYP